MGIAKSFGQGGIRNIYKISKQWYDKQGSLEDIAQWINTPIEKLEKDLTPIGGKYRFFDAVVWLENQRAVKTDSFHQTGASSVGNILLESQMDYLLNFSKRLDSTTSTSINYEELPSGDVVIERISIDFSEEVMWLIGHPIFDEIARSIWGDVPWVPLYLIFLQRVPGTPFMGPHRDSVWVNVPQNFPYPKFHCSFQLTGGDEGLYYIPFSHRNGISLPDVDNEGYPKGFKIKRANPNCINIINNGVIHGTTLNKTNEIARRIYMSFFPEKENYRCLELSIGKRRATNLIQKRKDALRRAKELYSNIWGNN